MAVYNPFDQMILDDPAYAEETKIDPQAGKKLVRDIYGLVLGEEDPYAKDKLERELSIALAQKEAGLPVDPNKSFVTSAERQDPVLGPALKKFDYKPMSLGEFGERAMEFLYRDQEKARSKQLRGEELTLGEKIAANPFMAALDAADFTGLIGLATKGGIKLSAKGLQTLNNLRSQGASKEIINQIMTTQFPDDAQKIGLVYYQTNRPPGMETSQIMKAPDTGGQQGKKFVPGSLTQQVYDFVMNSKEPLTKKDLMEKFNVGGRQLDTIFYKNPDIKTKLKDAGKTFSPYDYDKLEETFQKIKSGEIKSNLGPNAYGLNKNMTSRLLRDYEKFPRGESEKEFNFDTSKLKRPIEEYREVIPFYSNADQIRDYLRDLKGTITYKELQDKLGVTYGMVVDATTRAPDKDILKSKIQLTKYGTPSNKFKSVAPAMNKNKEALGLTKTITPSDTQGSREEFLLFDGLFRSIEPEFLGLSPDIETKAFADRFMDYMKNIDWKNAYKDDLATLKAIDNQRIEGNKIIREMFNEYKSQYPKQFKDLNVNDFLLQVAHNFPLRVIKNQFEGVGGVQGASRLTYARTNVGSHAFIENSLKEIVKAANEQGGKLTPIQQEVLASLDEQAKKLGTVAYASIKPEGLADDMIKVGIEEPPGVNSLISSLENYFKDVASRKNPKFKKFNPRGGATNLSGKFVDEDIPVTITDKLKTFEEAGTTVFKKGGPVHMAMGGDPLENLNQQQFTSDPAVDDDYFAKAVQDENLYAFNPTNLFKIFNKVPAMLTPKKTLPDMPTSEFTPVIPTVDPGDFPFKSYFLSAVTDPNTPKAARPQDWLNYFKGKGVKESELSDIGITQYFEDVEKFVPGSKVRKEDLVNLFEQSPISNIEIKVKEGDAIGEYGRYVGEPKHGGMGNAPIDNQGQNYRNIIINSPKLPGEKEPFFNTTHYPKDPNVLAFARVADYQNTDGQTVAVIQELQSDLLNNLRKEQERVGATVKIIRRKKAELQEQINNYPASNSWYQEQLDRLEQKFPESKLKYIENNDLVRPIDPIFAEKLAPELTKELSDIQDQINKLTLANRDTVVDPDYTNKIVALQQQGMEKFQQLYDLNRQANHDLMFEDFKVMSSTKSDEIRAMGERESYIPTDKNVQTFPRVPFNKGKDWIDLIIKGTIQDAQSKGINKVAIMPSDIVNQRWSKDINSPAAEKFKTLYDNISVQQLKEIAKKYTGNKNNLTIEKIVDPSKADKGLTFFNKSPDGEYQVLKQLEVKKEIPINERDDYYDEEIARIARNFEDKSVVYSREIAPGQTMDYYVIPTTKGDVEGYKFVPLGDGDNVDDALLKIEEYNPSAINMYTLTLPEESTKKGPMFLYGKKDGGKISLDGLVSITDIYGDY